MSERKKRLTDLIDKAKKELLNLGLRNPLLNFKISKTRGIEFSMDAKEVFNSVKEYENNIEILPIGNDDREKAKQTDLNFNTYDFGDTKNKIFFSNSNLPLSYASYYSYLIEINASNRDDRDISFQSKGMFWLSQCDQKESVVKEKSTFIKNSIPDSEKRRKAVKDLATLIDNKDNTNFFDDFFFELKLNKKSSSKPNIKNKPKITTNLILSN